MEVINLSLLSESLFNLSNKFANSRGGANIDNLPDPPDLPGVEQYQSIIKKFILFAIIAFVAFFFPLILFGLMLIMCWKFFNRFVLKNVKSI